MPTLSDPSSNKTWSARVEGNTVLTSTGGKERAAVCDSPEAADTKVVKDTWTKLKAGFVLQSPQPAPAAAAMLRHAGKGVAWQGRNAVCASEEDDSFFAVSCIDGSNLVRRIDPDGTLTDVATLPSNRLVRSISWREGVLYADVNGQIFRLDTHTGEVSQLTGGRFNLGGSLRLAGDLVAWHDGRDVVVTDLSSNEVIWRRTVQAGEATGGIAVLAMAVSTSRVAYTNDRTTIHVVDLTDGSETILPTPEPEVIDNMWVTEDAKVFTSGQAGHYTRVARYDLGTAHQDWQLEISSRLAVAFATMDHARTRLAVLYRYGSAPVQVIDAATLAVHAEFVPDYVVKSGACAFTRTGLALVTDYGCLGHYPLAAES